jgi:hypothetical protein
MMPSRYARHLVLFSAPELEDGDFAESMITFPTNWPPCRRERSGPARDRHKSIGADVLDLDRRVTTFDVEKLWPLDALIAAGVRGF